MIEAYAKGTPVIASRLGAMAELVTQNETGFLYEAGHAADLAKTIQQAMDQQELLLRMRGAARLAYERKFSADANYAQLIKLYERAIEDSCG